MRLIVSSFKQSFKLAPLVLKDCTFYFGFYFFVFIFIILALIQGSLSGGIFFVNLFFLTFSSAFTIFIIPYYTFKYSQGSAPEFWNYFIKNNVWPVVFAHIKAFFVILFFLLLLIFPGIYKGIRFSFLTETVLFDKHSQKSMLKQASANTSGFFWMIVLFFILYMLTNVILKGFLTKMWGDLYPNFFTVGINLILLFYLQCFLLLWKTAFFFEIKKRKGEKISC